MTREDAIKSLLQIDCPENIRVEAESVLIQIALQEPCEDTISREAAIKEAFQIEVDGSSVEVVQVETLMALPSLSSWIRTDGSMTNGQVMKKMFGEEFVNDLIYNKIEFNEKLKFGAWLDKPYVPDTKIGEMEE